MSKELILIVAYCPNKERKEILFDFLKQLQMFRCSYDILVASHTPLDVNFFEYFDYSGKEAGVFFTTSTSFILGGIRSGYASRTKSSLIDLYLV